MLQKIRVRLKELKSTLRRRNNCLFFALYKRIFYGGKIKLSKATRYFGSHFYWVSPEGRKEEYVPLETSYLPWYKCWKIIIFKGYIRITPPA